MVNMQLLLCRYTAYKVSLKDSSVRLVCVSDVVYTVVLMRPCSLCSSLPTTNHYTTLSSEPYLAPSLISSLHCVKLRVFTNLLTFCFQTKLLKVERSHNRLLFYSIAKFADLCIFNGYTILLFKCQ